MHGRTTLLLLTGILLAACSPATPVATPVPLTVQYTPAAQPWLANLYTCAGTGQLLAEPRSVEAFDPSADLAIRLGQPANLDSPAYRIGTEEIVVIVNRNAPVASLQAGQVRELFSGQMTDWSQVASGKSGKVQAWVFASGDDVEQIFEQALLTGTPVTSLARLAATPGEMLQAVAADENALGFLPRRWETGNVRTVYSFGPVPVLAIASSSPSPAAAGLIACLQK